MILFSRTLVRKRVISLATTASAAATSFTLAQHPANSHHVHGILRRLVRAIVVISRSDIGAVRFAVAIEAPFRGVGCRVQIR